MSNVLPHEIISFVAVAFGVKRSEFCQRKCGRPHQDAAIARMAAIYLITRHTDAKSRDIAAAFEIEQHPHFSRSISTTVGRAVDMLLWEPTFARRVEAAERMIDATHERRSEFPVADMADKLAEMHSEAEGMAA